MRRAITSSNVRSLTTGVRRQIPRLAQSIRAPLLRQSLARSSRSAALMKPRVVTIALFGFGSAAAIDAFPPEPNPQASWSEDEVFAANEELKRAHQIKLEALELLKKNPDDKAGLAKLTEFLSILKPLADRGHSFAQHGVATSYFLGAGVPKDERKALHYMLRCCAQNDSFGQNDLAVYYQHGHCGLAVDDVKAVKYYKLAYAQGHATAAYNLAFLYQNGRGVPQSLEKRNEYLYHAAKLGHGNAIRIIQSLENRDK